MSINYEMLLNKANKFLIKEALKALEGKCNIYISFHTYVQEVKISDALRKKYPDIMGIALQHQFDSLAVYNNYFSVTLSFDGLSEEIQIPFSAISVFHDKDANFHLQLDSNLDCIEDDENDTISSFEDESDKIISINKFLGKK